MIMCKSVKVDNDVEIFLDNDEGGKKIYVWM